jgi:hypothetical protein
LVIICYSMDSNYEEWDNIYKLHQNLQFFKNVGC